MSRAAVASSVPSPRDGGGRSVDQAASATGATPLPGYFEQTTRPLTTLVFLVPLILAYEVGTRRYAVDPIRHVGQQIKAFSMLQQFFTMLGATGQYMPAAFIVAVMLAWHLVRVDRWKVRPGDLLGMIAESVLYAVPLRALALAFAHYLPLYASPDRSRELIVLSVGAGVYEEMIFRFVAFALLSFLFVDLLRMEQSRAVVLIVLTSAIAFSAYHYFGSEPFEWRSFIFRTLAGVYFGAIFLWRGLGVTAGAHAAYDISTVVFALIAVR